MPVRVTKDRIEGANIKRVLELTESIGATLARLPNLTDFRSGLENDIEVKPVDVEDLLGRPQTVLDRASMKAMVHDKRVLVTGAGGTIGSELVRQIAAFTPARLSMLDASEFHLYEIDLELEEQFPDIDRRAVLADIRDAGRIRRIIADEAPELVFHAAALKHVPVVETHFEEGVLTNTIGNPLETTIALSHLIFEGTLDRFPGLKICASHGGGFLPSYANRSDAVITTFPDEVGPLPKKKPTEYIRGGKLYFDSIMFTGEAMRHLICEVGIDHVLLGTDYPFPWNTAPIDHIMSIPGLTDEDRVKILGGTAAGLLGIEQ